MKKLLIISIVFLFMSGILCLHKRVRLEQERRWFHKLYTEWNLFEADYTEDIKNIDKLRDDLRWEKEICQEWEKIAMEFKEEAVEYKMKYKEQYTINNIGLLSKGTNHDKIEQNKQTEH